MRIVVVVVLLSALCISGSVCLSQTPVSPTPHLARPSKGTNKTAPISEKLLGCEKKIADVNELGKQIEELSPAVVVDTKQQLTDCVFSETDLTTSDLRAAYSARDTIEQEIFRRLTGLATQFDSQHKDTQDRLQNALNAYTSTNTQFHELIDQYNGLVGKFNSLVDTYRTVLANDQSFARQIQQTEATCNADYLNSVVQSLQNQQRSAPTYNSSPKPLSCTTQNMPSPIPGQPTWSYTHCN